jgi:hypothetical protein
MSAPQAPAPLPMKKGIVKQVSEKNVEEIFVVILSIETVCQLNTEKEVQLEHVFSFDEIRLDRDRS